MSKEIFYKITNTNSHTKFDKYLQDAVKDKTKREKFYDDLIQEKTNLEQDIFIDYFQEYGAERKSNKQDYTPDDVSELLSKLVKPAQVLYDGAAGTGALLVAKWTRNKTAKIRATEYADNAIHYLIHNLAIRNIDAIVVHGDTISGLAKVVYRLEPGEKYSEVHVLPKNDETIEIAQMRGWEDEVQT